MRIPSGTTDQYIYFVAVDSTDFTSRETGFSSFTVYRSRNGAASSVMTTPTINETDVTNMPGVYELLLDEDMTLAAGNDSEEMVFHITHAGMAPVTRTIELYRPKITIGNTLDVTATGAAGIDWGNVENPTTAVDLSGTDIQLCDTITTYTGNTVQTGDTYALANGATGFAAIDTVVDAIKVKTDFLPSATAGAAGGVFIAGTNAATTITTGLTTTFTGNLTGSVGSVTGAVGSVTGAVGSVTGAVGSVTGAVGSVAGNVDGNVSGTVILADASSDAILADAIWNAATATYGGVGSYGEHVESLSAGGDATEAKQDTIIASLALVPQSGGTTSWNATALAAINAEVDTSMVTYGLDHLVSASVVGADITDNSIIAYLASKSATADWDSFVNTTDSLEAISDTGGGDATAANQTTLINAIGTMTDLGGGADIANNLADMAGATFATGTDSLEAIRNRGDAAWITGAGGSPPDVLLTTTIATLASQTSFTLTAGSTDDDAYNNAIAIITDAATATQKAVGTVSDYTGSTKTITLVDDPGVFTMAATDNISLLAAKGIPASLVAGQIVIPLDKNVAGQFLYVKALDSSGVVTGDAANITCTLSLDNGTPTATNDVNPTEIGTTGVYYFALTQAETNAETIIAFPGSSTAGVEVVGLGAMESNSTTVVNAGSETWVLTVESSGVPVAGVECWVSTDIAGSNTVAGTSTTDDFGMVTFYLDVGTYYLWRDSSTHTFPNPTAFTVS